MTKGRWPHACILAFSLSIARTSIQVRRLGCAALNYCHGHGRCVASTHGSPSVSCHCFDGWGSQRDIAIDRMHDCSQRSCPVGIATAELPTENESAHPLRECSNNGLCDRLTGECRCFESWEGSACERRACPNRCSGHGQCLTMAELATRSDALPLSEGTNSTTNLSVRYGQWEATLAVGCLCDSSWQVGLRAGQYQEPEWFGPDCSLRHCPSGNDPSTRLDETDCTNVTARGGRAVGHPGNLCHVDCSNRGICNTRTGICACFAGYAGLACDIFESRL